MTNTYLKITSILLVFTGLITSSRAFIDSPLDWAFAPNHSRGLVCPSLRYGCCSDLATWRDGIPCAHPESVTDPEVCYKSKEWACCQADVSRFEDIIAIQANSSQDDTFTCTTGFQKDGKREQYGWRSGTKDKYLGIGKGVLTVEEKQALDRSS
jgi:hypothetical protein